MVTLPKRGKLKDLMTDIETAINAGGGGGGVWGSITGTLSSQTDLQSALDAKAPTSALTSGLAGKSDVGHTHVTADVEGLDDALSGRLSTSVLSGTSKITVGTTAPVSPATGDIWIDTN